MRRSSVTKVLRLACVLWVLFLSGSRAAHAAGARRAVFLESAENAHPSLRSLLEATRAPLAELGVELAVVARPSAAGLAATTEAVKGLAQSMHAVAVVWLDTERAESTWSILYFFDSARSRLLSRRVEVSESEAAAAEEVAVVLRSAIGALLEGEEVAMTEVAVPEVKKATPPAPARPPPPAKPRRSETLGVGLAYVGAIFTEELSWQSGARLSLSLRPAHSRFWFAAAYEFLLPLEATASGITTEVERHPAEVTVACDLLSGPAQFSPELGLIADAVHRETERADAPLVATAPSTRWLWAASLRFRGRHPIGKQLSLVGALGADFVLNPFEQVAAQSDTQARVSSLLAVRPRIEAGFLLDLW